ncbi:MAG: family 16 glycoside hydrolase [Planctomycetota bacterium]
MRCGVIWATLIVMVFSVSIVSVQAGPPEDVLVKIKAALPDKASTTPAKPRKLLIFTLCRGFPHGSIPVGAAAFKMLGERTGAFEALISDDIMMFESHVLEQFDAVCLMNTTGELFMPPDMQRLTEREQAEARRVDAQLKQNLLDYIREGKGLIGIHAATDCFYDWPEFGELMGGYFDGHPWGANDTVTLKVDEPDHPLCAMFAGQPFVITDEIYQIKAPYSRDKLRVLLSLDTTRTDMTKQGIKRSDGDFAVSWVRDYGSGRVFYCSLGHRDDIFWNPLVLRHYLAGIQYTLGDLPAAGSPGKSAPADWQPLFNGQDLTGWKGLVGNPKTRAAMSAEELAQAQAAADEKMRAHWRVEDGVLVFDGQGESICTAQDYGDFEMTVDWKIGPGGDSGIYLRGSPQVQIWDPNKWPEGSGGLYNNQHNPSKPHLRADKPVGEWNTFRIQMAGERVTVWLNDMPVVVDVVLENHWERDKPIYPTGQIELQSHGSRLYFKNIAIREISTAEARDITKRPGWRELFNGNDLTGWQCKPDSWSVVDGALTRSGGGDIWTEQQFGDFALELEFKLAAQTNSGIFFRTANIADCVQTGIELQVLDSFGKTEFGKHDCGAIYDCLAPRVNAVRPPGEWNHVVLICRGNQIKSTMNGAQIINMDLDLWATPRQNPDGTPNKFHTAYKDMPRVGHIGFQDHGKPVWYRNIRIKQFSETAKAVPITN